MRVTTAGVLDRIRLRRFGRNEICTGAQGSVAESLNHGMVIGPGFFQAMCEHFDGLVAPGAPYNDADCRSTDAGKHPKQVLHDISYAASADENWMQGIDAWMGRAL